MSGATTICSGVLFLISRTHWATFFSKYSVRFSFEIELRYFGVFTDFCAPDKAVPEAVYIGFSLDPAATRCSSPFTLMICMVDLRNLEEIHV